MYFWKVDNLVADFRADKVTSKEEMKYIIGHCILLYSSTWLVSALALPEYNIFDYAKLFSEAFLSILGIYLCYRINSVRDNKDFAARMVCISFPVSVRVAVLVAPFYAIILLCFYSSVGLSDATEWWDVVLTAAWMSIGIWYLCKKIKDVSAKEVI
jgi:hypothetical protein